MLSDRLLVLYSEAHVKTLAKAEIKLTALRNTAARPMQMGTLWLHAWLDHLQRRGCLEETCIKILLESSL